MKKLFIILSVVLLNFTQGFGQAQIDIPFIITDGIDTFNLLRVGLDTTATDGIDPQLGEAILPPIPPAWFLFGAFDLSPYIGSSIRTFRDYRNAPSFPFTGVREHRLIWQLNYGAPSLTIIYNFPEGVFANLKDSFGGVIYNVNLTGSGSFIVPYGTQLLDAILTMYYNNVGGDPNRPIFTIAPLSLTFPQIAIGSDTSLAVTVTNLGLSDTLSITNIISSNNHFIISPNTFPISIAPLASQIFQVINTSAVNSQQGTLEFTHNAFGSPTVFNVSAPLGIQPGPVFGTSATSLFFLQMPIGTVDSLPITISNYGYINTLYVDNINSSNSYFNISPNIVPIVIAPQTFQTFYVTYTSADTLQQGTIEFAHNAPGSPSILNVSSVNSQSQFSILPSSLYFYSQPLSKRVWITNTGNFDTLIVTDIISSNSNYAITPNAFPVLIPPGSTKIFYVALNYSPGFQFGTIDFIHNAAGSPYRLIVSNQLISPQFEGRLVVQSGSMSRSLKFGLESLATYGIDEIFEESNIPPLPPPGAFDARFILPENNFSGSLNSYNDFRFGFIPITGQKEYRINYQQYYNNGIEIRWYLPHRMTGVLQDIINGTFINVPIVDSGSYIVSDPITFDRLRMLIDFNITTPVELISFNATVLNTAMKLNWSTATETNNRGFEVERKVHSPQSSVGNWEKIGFVDGHGTTTEPKSYSFTDEDVTIGKYKYRLKQIDYDGSFNYSNEIEVEVDFTPKKFVLYQNYPNPFNPSTVIKFAIPKEALVNLNVYNLLGEKVRELKNEVMQPGNYEVEFDASTLASGMYLYRIQAGEFVQIKKMILTK